MKILQVITSLRIGGAEKLVTDLSVMFRQEGHDVDVLIFDGIDTPLLTRLQKEGIRVIRYNKGGSVYNPLFILRLSRLIPKYDIVHTHNTSCQYFVAMAKHLCNCNNVKFITTEHSSNNRRRKLYGFKNIDKWMYNQYNKIVSISDKTTEKLQNFIGNNIQIETIYNGIDTEAFVTANKLTGDYLLKKNSCDFILCMVAGFRVEKDQDTLIKSLKLLPENVKLWLIGDGVRRCECELLANNLGVNDRVVFAGIRTDIPNILKSADVIIMSSHWEGLSLSSIEGMCVGKPFIASDVDGLHEIVDGYGLLFPHQNAEKLVELIMRLMNDNDFYQSVSEKCYNKACQYDIRKTMLAYLTRYLYD